MYVILLWALVTLIGRVHCKCSLAPIANDERSIAYACIDSLGLSDLDEISDEAHWIEFSVSRFQNIPDDAFARFRNLRRLSFYNCHVTAISPDAFRGLNRLDWLIFHETKIHFARAIWFRHLGSLRRLIMDKCGLVHIEPNVFYMLPRLETLGLRDNDLDCLPIEELSSLQRLNVVRIDGNPWLCECRLRLEKFFEERRIVQDEEECRKGPNVYRNLQCMAEIEIPVLPRILTVEQLKFFERNHTFMRGNRFETSVFTSLDRLPDKTTWIQISGLRIDRVPSYAFFRFGNSLRSLDLHNCLITSVEPGAFAGLHKLERLSLIGNRFPVVGADWFRDLVGLQQLILRENDITHIERTTFWHLTRLRHLDLRNNRLRCLALEDLEELRNLERLDALENPWTCTCRRNIERYLISRNIGFEISAGRCEDDNEIPQPTAGGDQQQQNITITTPGHVNWGSYEQTVSQRNITVHTGMTTPSTVPTRPTTQVIHVHTQPSRPPIQEGACLPDGHDHNSRVYSCSGLGLISTLNRIPSTAHTIRIHVSNLETISSDIFARFDGYLKRLELRDCGIKHIERKAFEGLYNLEYLSLHSNELESITAEYFHGLRNLKYLDLSRNKIFRVSNDVFDALPYLVYLDVSENFMNCIGVEHMARRLQYLNNFKVSGNPWSCLCGTKIAMFLDERGIPYDHTSLVGTSEECYITRPPSTATTRTTTLSTIPILPTVGTPSTMDANETVQGVCTVHEDGVGIRYRCSGGNLLLLKTIPAHVSAIEFYAGNVPHLPAGTFSRFHAMRELVIRNCGLRTIEPGAFDGLENLQSLTIQDNPLVMIGTSWFVFERLDRLDLRENSIKYIAPGAFRHLNTLTYLNLEGNDLKCIFTSDLNDMPNVHIVEFSGNPLKWRCRVDLEQFLEARKIKFVKIEESCEGKKLVRNLLMVNRTDSQTENCMTTCSAASIEKSFAVVIFIYIVRLIVTHA